MKIIIYVLLFILVIMLAYAIMSIFTFYYEDDALIGLITITITYWILLIGYTIIDEKFNYGP